MSIFVTNRNVRSLKPSLTILRKIGRENAVADSRKFRLEIGRPVLHRPDEVVGFGSSKTQQRGMSVVRLPRQTGQKEVLSGDVVFHEAEAAMIRDQADSERIGKLEETTEELQKEVEDLRKQFEQFRKQFE